MLIDDDKTRVNVGKPKQHGGYAYFPGTGPEGTRCNGCEHHVRISPRNQAGFYLKGRSYCQRWAELKSPGRPIPEKKMPSIDPHSQSCKEFNAKPKG